MGLLAERPVTCLAAGATALVALVAVVALRPHHQPQPSPSLAAPTVALPVAPTEPVKVVAIDPAPVPVERDHIMRGPYDTIAPDCSPCAIDVITAEGTPPIDEYTVVVNPIRGRAGRHETYSLAIRVGEHWWFYDLGMTGPAELDVDAPRQHGAAISVHTTERTGEGHKVSTAEGTVTCTVNADRIPTCRWE